MMVQMSGFQRRQTVSASWLPSPAITSGTGPNASGMRSASASSRSTFHREKPPMKGDAIAKTTRAMRVSRMGKEHITHGSTFEYGVQRHVGFARGVIDGFDDHPLAVADQGGEGKFARLRRLGGELHAPAHHRRIDRGLGLDGIVSVLAHGVQRRLIRMGRPPRGRKVTFNIGSIECVGFPSRSKLRIILARTMAASCSAKAAPMQVLGPSPNGR